MDRAYEALLHAYYGWSSTEDQTAAKAENPSRKPLPEPVHAL
jgi:hypothetical protein